MGTWKCRQDDYIMREIPRVLMIMSMKVLSAAVIATALTMASYPAAAEFSTTLKSACKRDYKRFCGVYGVNDPGLRKCMDKAGRSLSRVCVVALVNSGEITKERATQRWRQKID